CGRISQLHDDNGGFLSVPVIEFDGPDPSSYECINYPLKVQEFVRTPSFAAGQKTNISLSLDLTEFLHSNRNS
ncbi:hypothetical protein, partial [Klebsiella quasipneumoniae]